MPSYSPYRYQSFGKPTRRQQLQRRLLKQAKAGCEEAAELLMQYWSLRIMTEKELKDENFRTV